MLLQLYFYKIMFHGGKHLFDQIHRPHPEAGGIDAGVASEIFAVQHLFIDQQLHLMFLIVHQSQHADRTGGDIQKFSMYSGLVKDNLAEPICADRSLVWNTLVSGIISR